MTTKDTILILDFYGQYNQLIARRVRECGVYAELVPYTISIEEIQKRSPKGIIFTGGPASVYEEDAPKCDQRIFELGIPILGICYGMQLMAYLLGGTVKKASKREYGVTSVRLDTTSLLFQNFSSKNDFLMSHTDFVETLPDDFVGIAKTKNCPYAAIMNSFKNLYGVQFHAEVELSNDGVTLLKNFLFSICHCQDTWKMDSFVEETVSFLKKKIGNKKVLCALSGGVDSTVAATLVEKAIGKNLICIFVDHGLLRKGEAEQVEMIFSLKQLQFQKVDAKERFLTRLRGITDPEEKRKIIGEEFIHVFQEEAKKIGKIDYLVQGTIYPDVIESGVSTKKTIKSHHNVGGLPDVIEFEEILEPLRDLFKDEVRKVGLELGLPKELIYRQPFPGPGLAIRIIGDITEEKLSILKEADTIFREKIEKNHLNDSIHQYFAVLTNLRSVGVMGDERTYDYTVALRAVETSDFMTAKFAKIPYDILEEVSEKIVNEVPHVNRVVYDITSKPPATIEYE